MVSKRSWTKRGLKILLLAGIFLAPLFGPISNLVQNQSLLQVNGILGGSVLLSVKIPCTKIEWSFEAESGGAVRLAEFKDGNLEWINPNDSFGQRLEMANETTLRIKDLQMKDSGTYEARVHFSIAKYQDLRFQLTVYEPVPEPQILPQNISSTPDGCNVTLQCQVPGKGGFNVSWKRGTPLRDLEGGLGWYQLSGNNTNLHLSWSPSSAESSFSCLLHNPADRKNASFNLLDVCQTQGGSSSRMPLWWICGSILLILGAGLGIYIWKKRKKMSPNGAASMVLRPERTPVPSSPETTKRNPPEGDEDQEFACYSEPSSTTTSRTIYSKLKRPS